MRVLTCALRYDLDLSGNQFVGALPSADTMDTLPGLRLVEVRSRVRFVAPTISWSLCVQLGRNGFSGSIPAYRCACGLLIPSTISSFADFRSW